jgi:phage tail-like protein
MALTASDIKKKYPLPVFNFRVDILNSKNLLLGDIPVTKVGATSTRFSEVTGLDLSISPVVYRDGGSFITGPTLMAGMEQEVSLVLKRGIVQKDSLFYDWLSETRNMLTHGKRDLHIALCNEEGIASVQWIVRGAMPTKLTGPEFNAQSQEVAVETLELLATSLRMEFTA